MKLGLEIIYVKTNRWRQEISKARKKWKANLNRLGQPIETDLFLFFHR